METALKGREGKGILVDSTQPIESVTPAGVNDADLMAKFEAVCEACGFRPVEPGQISRNLKVVQDWIAAGYDFDTVVLPTIRKVVADAPDGPTRTLGRFRTYISHAHAQQAAQRSLGRKPRPPARAPDPPILAPPGEGDFRELRTILLERMGPDKYSLFANPIRFEDAGETAGRRPLRIRATPHLAEAWTSGTYASVLRNAARQFGFTEVWA